MLSVIWLLGSSSLQVQSPVVEQKRRIVFCRLPGKFGEKVLTEFWRRNALQVAVQNDTLHETLELGGGIQPGGRLLEAGVDLFEAGRTQTRSRSLGIGKLPREPVARKKFCVGLRRDQSLYTRQQTGNIPSAAALRSQPAPGTKGTVQSLK